MARRIRIPSWTKTFQRQIEKATRATLRAGTKVVGQTVKKAVRKTVRTVVRQSVALQQPPVGPGEWISGLALGPAGARRYRLYKPPGLRRGSQRPLIVMLHGCLQDAFGFAHSTRLHRIAVREGVYLLYPEQDRTAHPQGCWNWFSTRSGQTQAEVSTLMQMLDQVIRLYAIDTTRVAVAGFSAGASMAALLATRHADRFRAVAMHSGVPPGAAHSTATALGAMSGRRAPAVAGPATGTQTPWPPLLVIQGDADHVVAASNGREAAEQWGRNAGAQTARARAVQRGRRRAMNITDFQADGRTVATLCEVQGLGHAWSGGPARVPFADAAGPDASRLLWTFVSKQFAARSAARPKLG